jgi:hypothetical protein
MNYLVPAKENPVGKWTGVYRAYQAVATDHESCLGFPCYICDIVG